MALVAPLFAQTTQGLISGRLVSTVTGQGIGGAVVEYSSTSSTQGGSSPADANGYYTLPLLSPGLYRVRVNSPGFQSQEVQELELPVAARIELDFRMRPLSDVWETGQFNSVFLPGQRTIVTFFGPDVDTSRSGSFEATKGRTGALESTVSEVIDSKLLGTLPLEGRDVYTLLITQPGITSDAATGRGLGLSAIGQRPSASNFLLDGVENNNYLITGPLVTVAPEAIQEYRISTNNFSAEYGRTSGFLANAITRAGTDRYHGTLYFYLQNDALNANSFQHNLNAGLSFLSDIKPFVSPADFAKFPTRAPRTPSKQIQPGFVLTGPLIRNRLYASSSGEYFRSKSFQDSQIFDFPTASFFLNSQPIRDSYQLMKTYSPPPSTPTIFQLTGVALIAPPVDLYRRLYIERLDYVTPSGRDHLTGRVILNRLGNPTFIWTPYPDFVSTLHHNTIAPAITLTHNFRPGLTMEARVSYSDDDLHWNRPHPEVPTLAAGDVNIGQVVTLPGSPAFYEYKNVNRSLEMLDNVVWARGRHLFTFGAGALLRRSGGYLTAGRDAQYLFGNILAFGQDRPFSFSAPLDRDKIATLQPPQYDRTFRYGQYNFFVQDTWKLTPRLTLNYGLRWEIFGGPRNTGPVKDDLVVLGPGPDLATQLSTATIAAPPAGSGDQQLFGTDYKDFAPRVGATYDLFGSGRTLLRGAYGIFYDRPFDNLWENLRSNNFLLLQATLGNGFGVQTHFLGSVASQVAALAPRTIASNFPDLTMVPYDLKNGYAQSYFAGLQHRFTNSFTLEVNAAGSYGRRLITTDLVNRDFSTLAGRINPAITQDISYRAAQGYADYNGLTTVARYRAGRGFLQATYTWSHVIDNQSEPLLGDFFNLKFTDATANQGPGGRAAFTKQFNPYVDRGNATFDQRHNFIVFSYWSLPSPAGDGRLGRVLKAALGGWGISEMAAFRSGFPYNLIAPTNAVRPLGVIANNRPNVRDPNAVFLSSPVAVPGGMKLLNTANFTEPAISTLGNLGRNALSGPGFYNVDLAVSKYFALPWLGESAHVGLRVDAYNVLNHANLGNPVTQLRDPNFGVAFYGRSGAGNGFPATSPLNETPRVLQLSVRMTF